MWVYLPNGNRCLLVEKGEKDKMKELASIAVKQLCVKKVTSVSFVATTAITQEEMNTFSQNVGLQNYFYSEKT
jgi:hypothetical protein